MWTPDRGFSDNREIIIVCSREFSLYKEMRSFFPFFPSKSYQTTFTSLHFTSTTYFIGQKTWHCISELSSGHTGHGKVVVYFILSLPFLFFFLLFFLHPQVSLGTFQKVEHLPALLPWLDSLDCEFSQRCRDRVVCTFTHPHMAVPGWS